jgi:hypothetical protein
MLSNT